MIAWLVALLFLLLFIRQVQFSVIYASTLEGLSYSYAELYLHNVKLVKHANQLEAQFADPPKAYYAKPGIIGEHAEDIRA